VATKLFFWKKSKAKEIRLKLNNIGDEIKKLKNHEKKLAKTMALIEHIQKNIEEAEKDIIERGIEEKSKPYLDKKYDPEVDLIVKSEVKNLKKLSYDLEEYKEFAGVSENLKELDEVLDALINEEKEIEKKDLESKKKINLMQSATIQERMRTKSASNLHLNTNDGISWSNISEVARQLGGWLIVTTGDHPRAIIFPNREKNIPFSPDVRSTRVAKQVRNQLKKFMPKHKIPKKIAIENAFKLGDIRRAA